MINALLRNSCTQSTLFEFATTKPKMKPTSNNTTSTVVASSTAIFRQTTLPYGRQTAQKRLRELALRVVGKCVRVNEGYHRFVKRANIIYFRLCVSSSSTLSCCLSGIVSLSRILTNNVGHNHPKVFSCLHCSHGSRSAPTQVSPPPGHETSGLHAKHFSLTKKL